MFKSTIPSKYPKHQRAKPIPYNKRNKQTSHQYNNCPSITHSEQINKVFRALKKIGLVNITKICDSLQGNIFRATNIQNKLTSTTKVIKVTNIYLHTHSMAIVDNKQYFVNESILLEQCILKFLTQNKNCPKSIVKFKQFFKSNTFYFLVMEDGGTPLFDFIQKVHILINAGTIERNHWEKVVKIIFKQMIECIEYIHSKNICHFDISLENFVMNDVHLKVKDDEEGGQKVTFFLDDIQIKLCDFGLAEYFATSDCLSNKYCGKRPYKSPEVVDRKKRFDAKKNDIFGMGVCLFMMITGHAPWYVAHESDDVFQYVMNGDLIQLLDAWNFLNYINEILVDLLESIFREESDRISLDEIQKHRWIV